MGGFLGMRRVESGRSPKPEPLEDGPGRWRWFREADAETRTAHPHYYWFHAYTGTPRFFWNQIQVTEKEFRLHAPRSQIDALDSRSGCADIIVRRPARVRA
jgi:hypothetical protein